MKILLWHGLLSLPGCCLLDVLQAVSLGPRCTAVITDSEFSHLLQCKSWFMLPATFLLFQLLACFCPFLFVLSSYLLLRLCFSGLVPLSSDTVSCLLHSCPCPSLLHLGSSEAGKFSFPTRKESSKAHACYYPD